MSETESHKRAKIKAAGKNGSTEAPLSRNRRLDAFNPISKTATEVERSGNPKLLAKAARRLKDSGAPNKVLKSPQNDMDEAGKAMRENKVKGTISNLKGSKTKKIK